MRRIYKFIILSAGISLVFIVIGLSTADLDRVTTSYTVSTIYTTLTNYQNSNQAAEDFSAFSFLVPIIIICVWILYYVSLRVAVPAQQNPLSDSEDFRED